MRATDELIAIGGRTMLVKILKGSKDKKSLEHGLDGCPAYGYYHSLTLDEISHRVDWMIEEDYLRIDYNGRLPMLVFSEKGWQIEAETFAEEIYEKFCLDLEEGRMRMIQDMKDVNRQVVFGVLEKIRASRNPGFIPMLDAWKELEVRKVREKISSVQKSLKGDPDKPSVQFRKAGKGAAKEITDLVHKTVRKIYPKYYAPEVADFFCMLHSKERILSDILAGNVWVLTCDGRIVGTGSLDENHVSRVYVLPECQGKGYGARIMTELEKEIGKGYDCVVVEASLSSCCFYEHLGYHTVKHEGMSLFNDAILVYDVMEKKF